MARDIGHGARLRGRLQPRGSVGLEPTPEACVIPRSRNDLLRQHQGSLIEKYRPPQVRWGTIGTIVDMEERPAPNSGSEYWVRARFGDFITPWIEGWKVERVG
jgi:hypothetical protein